MTMKKRVYIAGPITGIENYREHFSTAAQLLKAKGYDVINPAELCDVLPEGATYEEILNVCLHTLLPMADYVALLPGWEKSRGANREYGWAIAMDLIVIELDAFIKDEKEGVLSE
jgi:nucleoside 2-deoxyribosyltransferase